ncbi:hypothetical protein Slin15195_G083440 [Septoria linicola]|uniref:Uncharacterized protein n=1 Tax=Septoria linicola TaxID=215465 RepID=A0A9Q9ATU0_9PEZI|nr:hypothetical protein Slin15195_G083440 [Septoria linicola]
MASRHIPGVIATYTRDSARRRPGYINIWHHSKGKALALATKRGRSFVLNQLTGDAHVYLRDVERYDDLRNRREQNARAVEAQGKEFIDAIKSLRLAIQAPSLKSKVKQMLEEISEELYGLLDDVESEHLEEVLKRNRKLGRELNRANKR